MVPRPWCWVPSLVRALGFHRVVGCSKLNSGAWCAMGGGGRVCGKSRESFGDLGGGGGGWGGGGGGGGGGGDGGGGDESAGLGGEGGD